MPLDLEQKINWLEHISNTLAGHMNEQHEAHSCLKDDKKELTRLGAELVQGFHWTIKKLYKLHHSAALEFNNWAIQNMNSFDAIFQQTAASLEQTPWDLASQMQQRIPQKYIHYFFAVGRFFYDERKMLKADRVFRLLTLLYPQHAEFWLWLGICQLQRQLPEQALICFTIASVLDTQDPHPLYYMSHCWLQLKGWDDAKKSLKKCLNIIGTNSIFNALEAECQEIQEAILSNPNLGKNSLPQMTMFYKKALSPNETINYFFLNNDTEFQFKQLIPEKWKALIDDLTIKTEELAKQLNCIKKSFKHEIDTLDFFERHSLTVTKAAVQIPLASFCRICSLALGFFLGELIAGMSISFSRKLFRNEIQTNIFLRFADQFSAEFERHSPSPTKSISKYVYLYNEHMDVAFNQEVKNPEYGSSYKSYQENNREDNRIRVSQFYREDILGKSILDCGCNEGGVLFACRNLGAKAITGFDINPWCIRHADEVVRTQKITDAKFHVGDMENRAFLSTLPISDTVLLLAILDTSIFVNKTAVIANLARFAKHTLYYEGHVSQASHVPRMYELLFATDFTCFEYIGRFAQRILIRCTRDIINKDQLPSNAITSDATDTELLSASKIYLFTDSPRNPPFSSKCTLIQFVNRSHEEADSKRS
jgi:ubiquinone/menaquinone biosynthesis C-methylase UbiE